MRKLRKFAKMRKCENENCENAQIFFQNAPTTKSCLYLAEFRVAISQTCSKGANMGQNTRIPVLMTSYALREHFCLIPVAFGKSKNLRKCSKDGKNARIPVPMTSYALREHFRLISVAFGKSENLRKCFSKCSNYQIMLIFGRIQGCHIANMFKRGKYGAKH